MGYKGAAGPIALFFVLFFVAHHAGADKCSAGCYGTTQPKGGFIEGNTYTYWVEGLANIQLSGAEKQETSVKLSAQATVVALGNCANLLKVTSLQITTHDGQKYSKLRDVDKPVRFTLQDGVLGSDICSEEGDSQKSLNIKRAILSMLQTATKHNTEVDVFGICPTTFTVNNDGANGMFVHKTRDLSACIHREQAKQDLLSYMYNPSSEIKNSNIMQSDMRSDVVVKGGIVEKVEVQEDYLYRPFSVGQAGARGSVTTKLVLKETNKGSLASKCVVPKSIIFENPHLVNMDHSNIGNILQALNTATQKLGDNVMEKSATSFVALIKALRVSSKEDMLNVYGQIKGGGAVKDNNLAKKVFLDALFRAGTGDSIEVSITLLQKKELTKFQQRLVLMSLTAVRHATSNSLKAAMDLIDMDDLPKVKYLAIGALAGAYCKEHQCHGSTSQDAGVAALSAKLVSKLGSCKTDNKKDEDIKMYILKGMRNIHHLEDSVVDKLTSCANDKGVRQRLRVAALETFTADACIPKLKTTALNILKDRQQDSEVRIKAYLALIECPDSKIAGELKTLLDSEPVYQVGAFIKSSLNNIRASTNPAKHAARQYFAMVDTHKKFPFNIGKYSQNFEMSYEAQTLGVGAVAEANVIYSQDSFLPRSANLNLTAEIFGRHVNLIEFGIRQGNLDRVIEEYFGPYGTFNTQTPQEMYNGAKKTVQDVMDKISERMQGHRTKRDVQKQIAAFGKKLKTDIKGFTGELDMDIFVKLFGTESIFLSLGDEQPASMESIIDRIFDSIESGVGDAKNFAHEVRHHILFMDMELAYPTSTGLTLKLNLEGAFTSKVNCGGSIDFKQLYKDPRNSKIEVKIIPSANVEITGLMSFDADVVVSGLKVIITLHTSTGSHVVFKMNDNGFDVHLGLPVEKQELISMANEIYFFKRNKGEVDGETAVKFDKTNWEQFSGCFDQLSNAIGLTLCGEVSAPYSREMISKGRVPKTGPMFPLSGQGRFSVRLEKENLKDFHIHGSNVFKNGKRQLNLVLETEGSKINRKVAFQVETSELPELKSLRLSLDSPIKTLSVQAALITNDKEHSLGAEMTNDKSLYKVKVGVISQGASTYKPILEYNVPQSSSKPISVEGTVSLEKQNNGRKYIFNSVCLVMSDNRITLDGYLQHGDKSMQSDLKLKNGDHTASFSNKFSITDTSTKGHAEFHNSLNPSADFYVQFERIWKKDEKTLDVSLVHGPDAKSTTNKISIYSCMKGQFESWDHVDYSYKGKFSYPNAGMSSKIECKVKPKNFELEMESQLHQSKAEFDVEFKTEMKKPDDFFGKIKMQVNDRGIEAEAKYDEITPTKGDFSFKTEVKPNHKFEVSGRVSHKTVPNDVDVGIHAVFKQTSKPQEFKFDFSVVNNPQVLNHQVKIAVGSTDYVDVLAKVTKEPQPSGTFKAIFKDLLNAQGQFKVNADKKGNGMLIVDFLKADRKVQFETSFMCAEPNYNFNVDIYPNHGKDNSQKFTYSTTVVCKEGSIDSKNSFIFNGDKTDVNFKCDRVGELSNGHRKGFFEFTRSSGKGFTVTLSQEGATKDNIVTGSIELSTVCQSAKGESPSKFTYNGRLIHMNKETGQREAEHHISIVKSTGEDLDIKLTGKLIPKKDRKQLDLKYTYGGALCKIPVSLTMTSDFYDGDNKDKCDSKYRAKGTFGEKGSLEVTGSYDWLVPDEGDAKVRNDFDIHVVVPMEKVYEVKFISKDNLIIPSEDTKYVELSTSNSIQLNGEWYKCDVAVKLDENNGKVKISSQIPKHGKMALDGEYKATHNEDSSVKYQNALTIDYGANHQLKMNVDGLRKPGESGDYTFTLLLPQDAKTKKVIADVSYKTPSSGACSSALSVNIDDKKYTLESTFDMSNKENSVIDFKASYPDGKPARVYIKAFKTGEHQYKGDSKFVNIGDFNLDLTIDATLISADNFKVKVDIDSEKLKMKKVHFEAANESSGKATKKIQFSAKEDNKSVLSGVTTYQSKQEGSKFIMEGSGTVKIRDESKTTSFKYIRDKLNEATEQGVEVFFNVALGEKKIVIEHKATNLEYKLSSVYCEENTQCANIDINNKLSVSTPGTVLQNMEISFDLRKLGFAPEFGLQTSTELGRMKLPVHSLNVHLSQEKNKYHTQVYAKPVKGDYHTAFTLTTPLRVISLESVTSIPDSLNKAYPLHHETVFYPNKNNPSDKILFRVLRDYQRVEKKSLTTTGEVFFSTPSLGKDLQILTKSTYDIKTHALNAEIIFDIFKKKNQKVVATMKFAPELTKGEDFMKSRASYVFDTQIDGKGLGFDMTYVEKFNINSEEVKLSAVSTMTLDKTKKDFALLAEATRNHHKFLFKVPSSEIIKYDANFQAADRTGKMDATVTLLQDKTYQMSTEVTLSSPYSAIFTAGVKNQGSKVVLSAKGVPMKRVELTAEHVSGKTKHTIGHVVIDTEAKSLKPQVEFNSKNLKPVMEGVQNNVKALMTRGQQIMKQQNENCMKDIQKLAHIFKTAFSDFSTLLDSWNTEFTKFVEELKNDLVLGKVTESVRNLFISISKVYTDILGSLVNAFKTITEAFAKALQHFTEVWTEKVLPELTNIVENITNSLMQIASSLVNIASQYIVIVSDFIDKHSADFKPIFEKIANALKELMKTWNSYSEKIREEMSIRIEEWKNTFAEFPLIQNLNEKLEEYDVPKTFYSIITEIVNRLREISPTEQVNTFLDSVSTYINKKMNKMDVNDLEALTDIIKKAVAALDSFFNFKNANMAVGPAIAAVGTSDVKFPTFSPFRMPSFVPPQFSFLNRLQRGNIPSFMDFVKSYKPTSYNPVEWIPPFTMQGYIAGGQHIFTFDNRHLTFPGSCRYVLAQDAVDGNFSIVLNLNKGSAESITLWDKSGNAIEVNKNTQLSLNGQKYGFPVLKADTKALLLGETFTLKSRYGARVICTKNLEMCNIQVSGFYLGKVRGLLGDGNNEPFDDFRLPTGKISTSESEFGNSYALQSSCAAVETVDHTMHTAHQHHHGKAQDSICDRLFGHGSSMRVCAFSIDVNNYKQACQHATAGAGARTKQEACLIARSYLMACKNSAIMAFLPDECSQCTLDGKTLDVGQTTQFDLPKKQADFVIAIETTKGAEKIYKEVLVPMMSSVVDELKGKNIDDVKVTLVGISPKTPVPLQFDIDNAKLKGAKIQFIDDERSKTWESPIATEKAEWDKALNQFAAGLQKVLSYTGVNTYTVSMARLSASLQWRPKAAKSVILVNSESCYKEDPVIHFLHSIPLNEELTSQAVSVHLIAPIQGLAAKGAKDNTIVGFGNENVFVMGCKKRGLSNPQMWKTLHHEEDNCIDLTEVTFGNVYSTATFFNLNAGQRKNYIQLASHTLVDSITETEIRMECECEHTFFNIDPKLECTMESRQDKRKNVTRK